MNIWVDAYGWPLPPTVLLGCLAAEILYFRGWGVLVKAVQAKEAARAKTPSASTIYNVGRYRWNSWFWRGISFLSAVFVFLLAACAPIDNLSSRFFWVHMLQHLLLIVVMPPLLVAAAPLLPLWLGLPGPVRKLIRVPAKKLKIGRISYQIVHWLRHPAISCALLIVGIWVWHWPPLYDLALTDYAIHDWCEHTVFLAVSILFWTQVIPSPPLRPRLNYPGRIACVGIAIAQNVVLAALIGFAQAPLYAPYAYLAALSGGISALQDQQIGAGIMWTVGDLPFGVAFSILVHRWLSLQMDETRT